MNNKLNEINKFTYKKLAELLFEFIPQYRSLENFGIIEMELGNYTFMNDFSIILCNEITAERSSEFVSNSFKFINCVSDSDNLEVLNILKVGILEILYTSGDAIRDFSLSQLNDKNKILFLSLSKLFS